MRARLDGRRLAWACVLVLPLAAAISWAQPIDRAQHFPFAIHRGSLKHVLKRFSDQTGLQFSTQLGIDVSKAGDIGPFLNRSTADDALTTLLHGTGLSYEWLDDSTITIYALEIRLDNIGEVLVTGSRIHDSEGAAPVKVYGRERIREYGISNLSDLSRYLTEQPFSHREGDLQGNGQFLQLRGLGYDTTLVLINGRRVPPNSSNVTQNAVNLNIVPIMAVDRVEVLSDSASAVYGADAIGGVVNVILKDSVDEPEIFLQYGQADGGGTQQRAGVLIGTDNDHLKSTFALDYAARDALMGKERDRWRNQDYRRFGGQDYRVSETNPGNVYSLTGQPLPGLSSSRAPVPVGATGRLSLSDFAARDGAVNLGSSFRDRSITPASSGLSVYGSAEYSFAEKCGLFGEVLMARNSSTTFGGLPSTSRQVVPASNPFNPFGVPVAVDYSFEGMDPISHLYRTGLLRLVASMRCKSGPWDWEVISLRHAEDGSSTISGDLDRSRVNAALNADSPQETLNLFSDGPAGAYELLNSLVAPSQMTNFSFTSYQLSAFARRTLFNLRKGPVELAIGGEWRHEAAGFIESGELVEASRDINSAFSEIRLPVLDKLALTIAVRGDDYDAGEPTVNPQYELTWRPASNWRLRMAYGRSFRPPSLYELAVPQRQLIIAISDPLRSGEVSNVSLNTGGNRDLELVFGHTSTVGISYKPAARPNLTFNGSYWRAIMTNRILVPPYQELLTPDGELTHRVMRDPPSEQDITLGRPGRVRSINLTRLNYGALETSGIDLNTSIGIERGWGRLTFDLAVTWVDEYLNRDLNQVLPLNRVGIASAQGTIPEWRTIGTLSWQRGPFGVSTTATFTPSYLDADIAVGPLDRRIDSSTLVDLQASANLDFVGNALLERSKLTVGAWNLFDAAPEFSNATTSVGYDSSQSELTGRFIYVRILKSF